VGVQKLGFGNPVSHVYMSFNMAKAEEARKLVKKGSGNKEGEHKVHAHTHTHTYRYRYIIYVSTMYKDRGGG
jgi:hypothetical protein